MGGLHARGLGGDGARGEAAGEERGRGGGGGEGTVRGEQEGGGGEEAGGGRDGGGRDGGGDRGERVGEGKGGDGKGEDRKGGGGGGGGLKGEEGFGEGCWRGLLDRGGRETVAKTGKAVHGGGVVGEEIGCRKIVFV